MDKGNMQEIVKIHNDINRVAFAEFDKREISMFYSLNKMLDEKGGDELFISFKDLKSVMGIRFESNEVFIDLLSSTAKKILSVTSTIRLENGNIILFIPFTTFEIQTQQKRLRIRVNPDYIYLFNAVLKNFTLLDLTVFNRLKTKYSQRLFSLLKQYRTTGRVFLTADEFRRLLNVPELYDNKKIGQKIITPCVKELGRHFKDLTVVKGKKGRQIVSYEFVFTPDAAETDDKERPALIPSPSGETESILCPRCGKEMIAIKNKATGKSFWGHKDYLNGPCQCTYSDLDELETDRKLMEEAKEKKKTNAKHQKKAMADLFARRDTLFDEKLGKQKPIEPSKNDPLP